jgi:hypothetical protein
MRRWSSVNSSLNQPFGDDVTAGNLLLVAVKWDGNGGVTAVGDTSGNTYSESPDCREWDILWDKTNFISFNARKRYYALSRKSGENTVIVSFTGPSGVEVCVALAEITKEMEMAEDALEKS